MTESKLRQRWQNTAAAPVVSLEYVQHRVNALEHRARRRNASEYIGFAIGMVVLGWAVLRVDALLLQLASVLCLLGGAYSLWKWQQMARIDASHDASSIGDGMSAYRSELERQHAARHNNWRWYIAPTMPGTVLLLVAAFIRYPERKGTFVIAAVCAFAWIALGMWANARAAADLQREIDALDSLRPLGD